GNEEKIDVGDVVRFKGGGSSMTVEKIEGNEAICVFSLGGKQRLKLEALEKVQDEPYWWAGDRRLTPADSFLQTAAHSRLDAAIPSQSLSVSTAIRYFSVIAIAACPSLR